MLSEQAAESGPGELPDIGPRRFLIVYSKSAAVSRRRAYRHDIDGVFPSIHSAALARSRRHCSSSSWPVSSSACSGSGILGGAILKVPGGSVHRLRNQGLRVGSLIPAAVAGSINLDPATVIYDS